MARIESTGWRDEALSRRHREWGVDCPAVDLDFLLIEFHSAEPVALIEYKVQNLRGKIDTRHPMMRGLARLGVRADLPVIMAFYWPELWAFEPHPLNHQAETWCDGSRILSEREWVTLLYRMRAAIIRDGLLPTLSTLKPTGVRPLSGVA